MILLPALSRFRATVFTKPAVSQVEKVGGLVHMFEI
jgi:hypothetical protein